MTKRPLEPLQIKRGKLARIQALGLAYCEPAIATDDPTKPRLLVGDKSGNPREVSGGGAQLFVRDSDPTPSDGKDDDSWFNRQSRVLFGPKTSGSWGAGIGLGGTSSSWNQKISETFSSLDAWTQFNGGTWSVSNGVVAGSAGAIMSFLRWNQAFDLTENFVIESEINFPVLDGNERHLGFFFVDSDGQYYGHTGVALGRYGGDGFGYLLSGANWRFHATCALTAGSWYKFRVVKIDNSWKFFINGVCLYSYTEAIGAPSGIMLYPCLWNYNNTGGMFRNVRFWLKQLDLPE